MGKYLRASASFIIAIPRLVCGQDIYSWAQCQIITVTCTQRADGAQVVIVANTMDTENSLSIKPSRLSKELSRARPNMH